jgi:hypothetical protein
MVQYNVTVKIDRRVHDEWIHWMLEHHIPEVLSTGLFLENTVSRMFEEEEEGDGITYAFQYYLRSLDDYRTYQTQFAPALQQDHRSRYEGRFVAFRTVMEVVQQTKVSSKEQWN